MLHIRVSFAGSDGYLTYCCGGCFGAAFSDALEESWFKASAPPLVAMGRPVLGLLESLSPSRQTSTAVLEAKHSLTALQTAGESPAAHCSCFLQPVTAIVAVTRATTEKERHFI